MQDKPENIYNFEDYYHPAPEDFEPEPPKPEGPLSRLPKAKHLRPGLILFIFFYIASVLHSDYKFGDNLWVSGETVFKDMEYWRLLTSIFAHADILHLLSNAMMFLIFGWLLRAYFGFLVFPIISLIVGVIGTLLTVAVYDPHIRLVGASGMNYGMAALWLVLFLRHDTDHYLPQRILRVAGFTLVVLLPSSYNPQTSYLAHAMGFLSGLGAGILILPFIKAREPGGNCSS